MKHFLITFGVTFAMLQPTFADLSCTAGLSGEGINLKPVPMPLKKEGPNDLGMTNYQLDVAGFRFLVVDYGPQMPREGIVGKIIKGDPSESYENVSGNMLPNGVSQVTWNSKAFNASIRCQ